MRFSFGDTIEQQAGQQTPNFAFGQSQQTPSLTFRLPHGRNQENRNYNFGSVNMSTGFQPQTVAAPVFGCGSPSFGVRANAPFSISSYESSTYSLFSNGVPTPLANLFGSTSATTNTGFGHNAPFPSTKTFSFGNKSSITTTASTGFKFSSATATSRTAGFNFGTAATTTTNTGFYFGGATTSNSKAGFCFGNGSSSNTNTRFGFRPPQVEGTFIQTSVSGSGYTFGAAPTYNSASTFGFNLNSTNCISSASPNFTFCNPVVSKPINLGGPFDTNSTIATSSVSTGTSVTSGFSTTAQQLPGFQFSGQDGESFQFSSAASSTTLKFKAKTATSKHLGSRSNVTSSTRTVKLEATTVTNLKSTPLVRNHCIIGMKECENKSLEELRLEDYDSNRRGGSVANSNSFRNDAPCLSFFKPAQFPLSFTSMTNASGSMVVLKSQAQQNQAANLSLTPSNGGGNIVSSQSQLSVAPKSNSTDSKLELVTFNDSNAPRCLIAIMLKYLGMADASLGKSFAFDSLIAIMIISKMISIPEALALLRGNVNVDDLKTHLIRATNEFNSQILSEIFKEEIGEECVKIKEEPGVHNESSSNANKTVAVIQPSTQTVPPADTSFKVIHIQIRLPNGEFLSQKFVADDSLLTLLQYISSKGYPVAGYKVLVGWPYKDLTSLNPSKTLGDLLCPMETLTLEKR